MKPTIVVMIIILIMAMLFTCCNTQAQNKMVYVQYVHDGDTFKDDKGKSYRIAEIDCPEIGQPYGEEAKVFTNSLINHKYILVKILGYDEYCRAVCRVYLDNNIDLGKLIVSNGYAWVYRRYASQHMYMIYVFAKRKHKGLWASYSPEPPFKYRNKNN